MAWRVMCPIQSPDTRLTCCGHHQRAACITLHELPWLDGICIMPWKFAQKFALFLARWRQGKRCSAAGNRQSRSACEACQWLAGSSVEINKIVVAEGEEIWILWRSGCLYSQRPRPFWLALAGFAVIGSCSTAADPLVRFYPLHEPMAVQFHCVIE